MCGFESLPGHGVRVQIEPLQIPAVRRIRPRRFDDARGSFAELANAGLVEALGLEGPFAQDNWSFSRRRGTLRGMHFSRRPAAQGKLVRVTRGAILDVAVDVRAGSPTFARHVAVELTADRLEMVWVPEGFAHGFVTLEDATEVTFKVSHPYVPALEVGIRFDDPALGIDWGLPPDEMTVSERDRHQSNLSEVAPFAT